MHETHLVKPSVESLHAPAKSGTTEPHRAAVDWTEDVLREFVLPELRPDVLFNWLTEPDHLVPTILALKGIPAGTLHDGRVLRETLIGGPDEEQVPVETRVLTTEVRHGHYQAAIQVSRVEHQRYVDKSWRVR
jgi:hypothetical protein